MISHQQTQPLRKPPTERRYKKREPATERRYKKREPAAERGTKRESQQQKEGTKRESQQQKEVQNKARKLTSFPQAGHGCLNDPPQSSGSTARSTADLRAGSGSTARSTADLRTGSGSLASSAVAPSVAVGGGSTSGSLFNSFSSASRCSLL